MDVNAAFKDGVFWGIAAFVVVVYFLQWWVMNHGAAKVHYSACSMHWMVSLFAFVLYAFLTWVGYNCFKISSIYFALFFILVALDLMALLASYAMHAHEMATFLRVAQLAICLYLLVDGYGKFDTAAYVILAVYTAWNLFNMYYVYQKWLSHHNADRLSRAESTPLVGSPRSRSPVVPSPRVSVVPSPRVSVVPSPRVSAVPSPRVSAIPSVPTVPNTPTLRSVASRRSS